MSLSLLPHDSVFSMADDAPLSRAAQACLSCRKQKRRCDKRLPACALCKRMGRPCDYTDVQPAPTADDLAALQMKLAELENRLRDSAAAAVSASLLASEPPASAPASTSASTSSGCVCATGAAAVGNAAVGVGASAGAVAASGNGTVNGNGNGNRDRDAGADGSYNPHSANRFPAAVFLDIDAFRWSQSTIPRPVLDIPMEVLEIISRGNTIQETAQNYFSSVHLWFPIVSKKRLNLGLPLWDAGPDVALLFLAMRLVSAQRVDVDVCVVENEAYLVAKRFIARLEAAGVLSLQYLQAMLLVALYEYGHAIYPAAWMTVAACARYADLIGLPRFSDSSMMLGICTTWTESEERKRVWWGVFILDRVMSLGNKRRFAAWGAVDREVLPVDDVAWDEGDMVRAVPRPATTPFDRPVGDFARICQAAMLIDETTRHCTTRHPSLGCAGRMGDAPLPADVLAEADALCDALHAFTALLEPDLVDPSSERRYFALATAHSMARSSLVMLWDVYACPPGTHDATAPPPSAAETEMQARAVVGLRGLSDAVRDVGMDLLERVVLPTGLRCVSPFVLDAFYGCMATLRWLWKESGNEDTRQALEDIKHVLAALAMRWALATTYLGMERLHDGSLS